MSRLCAKVQVYISNERVNALSNQHLPSPLKMESWLPHWSDMNPDQDWKLCVEMAFKALFLLPGLWTF